MHAFTNRLECGSLFGLLKFNGVPFSGSTRKNCFLFAVLFSFSSRHLMPKCWRCDLEITVLDTSSNGHVLWHFPNCLFTLETYFGPGNHIFPVEMGRGAL